MWPCCVLIEHSASLSLSRSLIVLHQPLSPPPHTHIHTTHPRPRAWFSSSPSYALSSPSHFFLRMLHTAFSGCLHLSPTSVPQTCSRPLAYIRTSVPLPSRFSKHRRGAYCYSVPGCIIVLGDRSSRSSSCKCAMICCMYCYVRWPGLQIGTRNDQVSDYSLHVLFLCNLGTYRYRLRN